jgi:hypothetical protein
MHETDLHLEPNEASDLCRVFDRATLRRHGWDRAFATVLDEATAEDFDELPDEIAAALGAR